MEYTEFAIQIAKLPQDGEFSANGVSFLDESCGDF